MDGLGGFPPQVVVHFLFGWEADIPPQGAIGRLYRGNNINIFHPVKPMVFVSRKRVGAF